MTGDEKTSDFVVVVVVVDVVVAREYRKATESRPTFPLEIQFHDSHRMFLLFGHSSEHRDFGRRNAGRRQPREKSRHRCRDDRTIVADEYLT